MRMCGPLPTSPTLFHSPLLRSLSLSLSLSLTHTHTHTYFLQTTGTQKSPAYIIPGMGTKTGPDPAKDTNKDSNKETL